MLLSQSAQEERREAHASKKAQGKEHAVQVSPPRETDKAMVRCLQE